MAKKRIGIVLIKRNSDYGPFTRNFLGSCSIELRVASSEGLYSKASLSRTSIIFNNQKQAFSGTLNSSCPEKIGKSQGKHLHPSPASVTLHVFALWLHVFQRMPGFFFRSYLTKYLSITAFKNSLFLYYLCRCFV